MKILLSVFHLHFSLMSRFLVETFLLSDSPAAVGARKASSSGLRGVRQQQRLPSVQDNQYQNRHMLYVKGAPAFLGLHTFVRELCTSP